MHVSPTQIDKYRLCPRLISWEYVEKITPPTSPKMGFGSDVHTQLENWLSKGIAPDRSAPGQVALQGIRWLPAPSKKLLIEKPFKLELAAGLEMTGRIDCVVPPELSTDRMPVVIDHKSTSSLKWAKTADDLFNDLQTLVYSAWTALEYSTPKVRLLWIYYAASSPKAGPRKPAGVKPVEIIWDVTSDMFSARWDQMIADIVQISNIRTNSIHALDLPAYQQSCSAWGGCYFAQYCNLSGLDKLEAAIKQEIKNDKAK